MFLTGIVIALSGATIPFDTASPSPQAGETATEVRKVGPFEGLAIDGSLAVEVRPGQPAGVTLAGPPGALAEIDTYVEHDTLHVAGGGDGVKVSITVPVLRHVAVAGSGSVVGLGRWKSDTFSVALSGSGRLEIAVDSDQLEIAVSGSGDVRLAGDARVAKVAVQGSGDVALGVKERLQVAIAGSGDVTYRGPAGLEPEVATAGSGRVRRAD